MKSQDEAHPFYLSAHMGGEDYEDDDFLSGDPEHVNVIAPKQYLSRYSFFTDPTYRNTSLVFVRELQGGSHFDEVWLDCMSAPVSGWRGVGVSGR